MRRLSLSGLRSGSRLLVNSGTLRFKRNPWSGGNLNSALQPWWHIAAHRYAATRAYQKIEALCGYATSNARRQVDWSKAVQPLDATLCENCERIAKERKNA